MTDAYWMAVWQYVHDRGLIEWATDTTEVLCWDTCEESPGRSTKHQLDSGWQKIQDVTDYVENL